MNHSISKRYNQTWLLFTLELAEEDQPYSFKLVFHGPGDRTFILGADSQELMEEWMKAIASASYDYMKLMVLELQRQVDELTGKYHHLETEFFLKMCILHSRICPLTVHKQHHEHYS